MFTDEQLDQARGADLVELVWAGGTPLEASGSCHIGRCPFCKKHGFHVNGPRGFFHCFGCKESGSAIDFVMKRRGLTFEQAVCVLLPGEALREDA
jgi:DNA primase